MRTFTDRLLDHATSYAIGILAMAVSIALLYLGALLAL